MNTKNILSYCLPLWLLIAIVSLGSCMSDSLNLDPDKIKETDLDKDNLWGTYLTTMQRNVVPEDVNNFQLAEDLVGNMYGGYFAGAQSWEGGSNGTTYAFPAGWLNRPFSVAFVNFLSSWNILRQKVDSTSVLFAVGEVVKVTAMHKTTDIYGPIPYTKFGLANPVPYDSQETVYKSFFAELDHAIEVLTNFDQINPKSKALAQFDLIFNSDIPSWIRYANSLKLRLAMRVRYAYPEAQKIAESAVAHKYGVITSNENNPTMKSNATLSFTYHNPEYSIYSAEGYEEDCMSASMESYLLGFEDPRCAVFFKPGADGQFHGLRNGHANGSAFKGHINLSKPNIAQDAPYLWMNAAEVYFLRAEGALLDWQMQGAPEELYEAGIRASFEQHNLSGVVDEYIVSENQPARYNGFTANWRTKSPGMEAPSNITVAWNDLASFEKKLERIITQKWLAMYPMGQEAWSEFRRTGYPKLFPVVDNRSEGTVNTAIQIRRYPFPESEYSGNGEEVTKAVALLNGPDHGGTRLWWDNKK